MKRLEKNEAFKSRDPLLFDQSIGINPTKDYQVLRCLSRCKDVKVTSETGFQCQQSLVSYSKWMQWIKRRGRRQLERETRRRRKSRLLSLFCLESIELCLRFCLRQSLSLRQSLFLFLFYIKTLSNFSRERETATSSFPLIQLLPLLDVCIDVRN